MARLYGRRWTQARQEFIAEHPYCAHCEREGRMVPGAVVDHIEPHRGNVFKFWDVTNWQTLCETHHNAGKQSQEKTGRERGCDMNGTPIDPEHHWRENHE